MPEKTRVFMVGRQGAFPIVSNFEVTMEKLVYGGDGLARLDGRVVFVPFVLPVSSTFMRPGQAGRAASWSRPDDPGLGHQRLDARAV